MRLLAVLLVPAFIGMVVAQQYGGYNKQPFHQGHQGGMRDQATFAGGSSRGRGAGGTQYIPGAPYGAQQQQYGGYNKQPFQTGHQGGMIDQANFAGGTSRGRGRVAGGTQYMPQLQQAGGYNKQPFQTGHQGGMVDQANFAGGSSRKGTGLPQYIPGAQHAQGGGVQSNVNHMGVGAAPIGTGGSSRGGTFVPNQAPVRPGPISDRVAHANAGAAPDPSQQGGSSGLADVPLGPVQTDFLNQVNMVNAGAAPVGGNQNSGEAFYDYGGGAAQGGGVNNAPQVHPQQGAGYGERTYNGAGGSSSGNNGPAFAAGPYSDNAGAAPLGGAALNEFNQDPAASTGVASVGSTVAGVVIAVLVLVGIVAVAAVFLVRQRTARMSMSNV